MYKDYYAVIMAGGGGTRLWPLSRKNNPKQMLKIASDLSLYQTAIQRLEGIFPPERILVVTVEDQAVQLKEQVPAIPAENFLIEPMPRGTASVIGYAAIALKNLDPNAVMAVLTADHLIEDVAKFQDLLVAAYQAAKAGNLVTLGIEPTHPATGYGYIQQGDFDQQYNGFDAYQVLKFKEKPDLERAQEMLVSQDHAWNSGMFFWSVDQITSEFHRQMPILAESLDKITAVWNSPDRDMVISEVWPAIVPETIDYGIMENAEKVVVIPAKALGWNDIGSWDALYDVLKSDDDGNIVMSGEILPYNSKNVLALEGMKDKLIVTIGVDDLVVIDTPDVLLVCKKQDSQSVRDIVKRLNNEKSKFI